MKGKFIFEPASLDAQWDAFVQRSPEGTIFSESVYLRGIERKAEGWYVLKGEQVKAGVVVLRSKDGSGFEIDDDVIYGGLWFAPPDENWGQRRVQTLSERFQITEFVVAELTQQARKLALSLAPGITDIRPFLWHNYHETDRTKRFQHNLRYTSILRIDSILQNDEEETAEFQALGTSRKQEIRFARRQKAEGTLSERVDEFIELMELAASKQQEDFSARRRHVKTIIENLKAHGRGVLFAIEDNSNQHMIGGAFFGIDSKRAYYLHGANHPELRSRFSGTIVLWDAFKHLRKLGIQEIDLEGVNSPKRGWFKMSFGGELCEYHELTLGGC